MREDGRQQVCIVGLQEFEVFDVQIVKEFIEKGSASRSTGSTGANEESSRSHAILQLVVKKHNEVKEGKRNTDGNEARNGKVVGKISFIDLAGSERGADTTDNDRQTRYFYIQTICINILRSVKSTTRRFFLEWFMHEYLWTLNHKFTPILDFGA
jgi:hypothetical protein